MARRWCGDSVEVDFYRTRLCHADSERSEEGSIPRCKFRILRPVLFPEKAGYYFFYFTLDFLLSKEVSPQRCDQLFPPHSKLRSRIGGAWILLTHFLERSEFPLQLQPSA